MTLDRVPEALFLRATASVSARLKPRELHALKREARRRGVAPSALAADLIRAGLQTTTKGVRRRNAPRRPARVNPPTEESAAPA